LSILNIFFVAGTSTQHPAPFIYTPKLKFLITSKITLANPVTTMPATHKPKASFVGKSLLNVSTGESLFTMNIALTTSR
jgi:hypothetical protein